MINVLIWTLYINYQRSALASSMHSQEVNIYINHIYNTRCITKMYGFEFKFQIQNFKYSIHGMATSVL